MKTCAATSDGIAVSEITTISFCTSLKGGVKNWRKRPSGTEDVKSKSKMELLHLACVFLGVPTETFFRWAYEYYEIHYTKHYQSKIFLRYVEEDFIPDTVFDYAIEVLAGRARKPEG